MIRRRLDEKMASTLAPLTSRSVDGPDPAFTDALEARLLMIHEVRRTTGAGTAADVPVGGRSPRRPPAIGWLGWLAPAALAGAGVAGALLLSGSGAAPRPTGPAVEVAHAVDAQSISPDGTATPLHPGARLPEGTVVRTGATGQVQADGTALGPDTEAVVHGGHLTVLGHRHGHQSPPTTTTQPETSPAQPATPPKGGRRGGGGEPASPSSPSTPPSGPGRRHAAPGSGSLQLSTRGGARGTEALSWSPYSGPGLYGYVVLRSSPPAEPSYPGDVIRFVPASGATSYVDSAGRSSRDQVDAIDSSGDVLASSPVER